MSQLIQLDKKKYISKQVFKVLLEVLMYSHMKYKELTSIFQNMVMEDQKVSQLPQTKIQHNVKHMV